MHRGDVGPMGAGNIYTTLAHSDFGDTDCCGCLNGIVEGEHARIRCNECGAVLATVPTANLEKTFTDMELVLDLASAHCPHCGSVNLFPGFSQVVSYICQSCGRGVTGEPTPGNPSGGPQSVPALQEFAEGEGPEIQTGISPECQQGNCINCKGFAEYEGQTIFCVHDCHKTTEPN